MIETMPTLRNATNLGPQEELGGKTKKEIHMYESCRDYKAEVEARSTFSNNIYLKTIPQHPKNAPERSHHVLAELFACSFPADLDFFLTG